MRARKPRRSTKLATQHDDYGSGSATSQNQAYADTRDCQYAPTTDHADHNESTSAANPGARFSDDRIESTESHDRHEPQDKKIAIGFRLSLISPISPFILASILLVLFSPVSETDFDTICALSFGIGFYFFVRFLFISGRTFSIKRQVFSAITLTTLYAPVMGVTTLIYAAVFNCVAMNNCSRIC